MSRFVRSAAAAAICLAAVACNPSSPAPVACASPKAICTSATGAAQCLDLSSDKSNCGGCGIVCADPAGGTASCAAGRCAYACTSATGTGRVCDATQTSADGGISLACTDVATDPRNCGACGNLCASDQVCTGSKCAAAAGALTQCGVDATGAVIYKDLESDRANCGACGTACGGTEICEGARCLPCAVAQCGNSCVDTQHDPHNCGACGNVVAGAGSCENGHALGAIALTPDATLASGAAPAGEGLFPVTVTVHSGVRLQSVYVQTDSVNPYPALAGHALPDGGTGQSPPAYLAVVSGDTVDVSPTHWTFNLSRLQLGRTGDLIFTALDEQWRPGDPLTGPHAAQLTLSLVGTASPAAPTLSAPALTVGGAAAQANAWIPLNAGTANLTSTLSAAPAAGETFQFVSNGLPIAATVNGTTVSAAVSVSQLGLGARSIVACAYDLTGAQLACSPPSAFVVGGISQSGFARPVLTRSADGTHTIWTSGPSGASLPIIQPYDRVTSVQNPGPQLGGADAVTTLWPTADATGVLALRSDRAVVERFDCPGVSPRSVSGGAVSGCWSAQYITGPAGVTVSDLVLVTSAAVLANTSAGPAFAPAVAAQTSAPIVSAGSSLLGYYGASSAGLIAAATSTNAQPPTMQVELFHPKIPGQLLSVPVATGTATGGLGKATVDALYVGAGGTVAWTGYDENGVRLIDAAFFDGTTPPVKLTRPQRGSPRGATRKDSGNPLVVTNAFLEVVPGRIIGAFDLGTGTGAREPVEIDFTQGTPPRLSQPTPLDPATDRDALMPNVVADRYQNTGWFAVSDDKTKALYATLDNTVSPAVTTLHLLDLKTGTAQPLTATQVAFGPFNPQFVHAASSYGAGALTGQANVVVWSEYEPSGSATNVQYARLSYAKYDPASTAAATVTAIDRPLVSYQNGSGSSYTDAVISAAAQGVIFLSPGAQPDSDLVIAAFTGGGGTQAATTLMSRAVSFAVREDAQRLAVARNDGGVFAGPLTSGGALAAGLQQVAQNGYVGPAGYAGFSYLDFTPDGNNLAFVALPSIDVAHDQFFRGFLETVDLVTLQRTNWGGIAAPYSSLNQSGPLTLSAAFVGPNADVAFVVQPALAVDDWVTFAVSGKDAPTARTLFPGTALDESQSSVGISQLISRDAQEGLIYYAPFGGSGPSATGGFARSDKSLVPFSPFFGQVLSQEATAVPATPAYGGNRFRSWAPEYFVSEEFQGQARISYKLFGGATARPAVLLSGGGPQWNSAVRSVRTPDQAELLLTFAASDATYVSAVLPLAGATPPPLLLP